ncbi:MAG: hypothetical protein JJU41_05915 [Bacteroidetes bacterium]|nr:hypothetical protein [Bacteroidota bacterium]MCH8523065.1 DUF3098 domain-containing protein [Balneolales bacterium]
MPKGTSRRARAQKKIVKEPMLFDRMNYTYLLAALVLILGGFLGMYIENEFLGWFSLYIAPIMIIGGYIVVAIAILRKSDKNVQSGELS